MEYVLANLEGSNFKNFYCSPRPLPLLFLNTFFRVIYYCFHNIMDSDFFLIKTCKEKSKLDLSKWK